MVKYPIIKNPEFIDLQKTFVRFLMVDENGKETVAEFKVPENREPGVNEFWDRIVQEFDIEEMRRKRNELETRIVNERERLEKKKLAQVQNEILKNLFDQKLYFFNLPFINELTDEEKSSIRRAPNISLLNMAISTILLNYTQRSGKTLIDIFDMIEDQEFQSESEVIKTPTENNEAMVKNSEDVAENS